MSYEREEHIEMREEAFRDMRDHERRDIFQMIL